MFPPEPRNATRGCPLRSTEAEPLPRPDPQHIPGRNSPWERLRRLHGPLAPVEIAPGVRVWLTLTYEATAQALRSPTLSNDPRHWEEFHSGRVGEAGLLPLTAPRDNALTSDGETHRRRRAPLVDGLVKLTARGMGQEITAITDRLIDSFIERGHADLIGEFATRLPALVLSRAYGLSDGNGLRLAGLASRFWDCDPATAAPAAAELEAFFAELTARARRWPGEDLASWMITHPSRLSETEIRHGLMSYIAAGNDLTAHLIANTLVELLADPAPERGPVLSHVDVGRAVRRACRVRPPLRVWPARYAIQDTDIAGVRIGAGEGVAIGFEPAHEDPALAHHVEDAEHALLTWGAGTHTCPARSLAWEITEQGVTAVLRRLREPRLALRVEELRPRPGPLLNAFDALPVRFVPGRPASATRALGPGRPARPRPRRRGKGRAWLTRWWCH
ncbi:cytochrome P450 [Marinactinospora endophytica]